VAFFAATFFVAFFAGAFVAAFFAGAFFAGAFVVAFFAGAFFAGAFFAAFFAGAFFAGDFFAAAFGSDGAGADVVATTAPLSTELERGARGSAGVRSAASIGFGASTGFFASTGFGASTGLGASTGFFASAGGSTGRGAGGAACCFASWASWAFTSSRRAWTRAARSELSSRTKVRLGVLRRRIFWPTSWRSAPRCCWRPAMAPCFWASLPKTETNTFAWVKSEVTSTPRMVTKPGRGSRRPRIRRSPRTFWISSATRAVRMDMQRSKQATTRSATGTGGCRRPKTGADVGEG